MTNRQKAGLFLMALLAMSAITGSRSGVEAYGAALLVLTGTLPDEPKKPRRAPPVDHKDAHY